MENVSGHPIVWSQESARTGKRDVCGLDFTPHRADDLPAYLVIIIVGHVMVPLALWMEINYSPPVVLQLAIYLPATLLASLLLLQPVKGAVVGLQWALRMHGFDEENPTE
jgi:uncharacterized protein (DUF983 family)